MASPVSSRPAEAGGRFDPVTAGELHVPTNTPGAVALRPFRILDMLVLILALGPGLTVARLVGPGMAAQWQRITSLALPGWTLSRYSLNALALLSVAMIAAFVVAVCLLFETVALLLLRLAKPCPPLAALPRQPGVAACLAALAGIYVFLAAGPALSSPSTLLLWKLAGLAPATCVVAAWSFLAMTGRMQAEPSWIDRAGRVLGVAWIAVSVVAFGSLMLMPD